MKHNVYLLHLDDAQPPDDQGTGTGGSGGGSNS